MIIAGPSDTSESETSEDALGTYLVVAFVSLTISLLLVAALREGTPGRAALALLAISSVACASLVLEGVVGARIQGWLALKASAVAIVAVVGTLYTVAG